MKQLIILLSICCVITACNKNNTYIVYTYNYRLFDSTIRNNGIITVDTNYGIYYNATISIDSATNQLNFRNTNYSLQTGSRNTYGSFPSDVFVVTTDSIAISYANPAVVGG